MWIYTNHIEPANAVIRSAIRFWMLFARSFACRTSTGLGSGRMGVPRCPAMAAIRSLLLSVEGHGQLVCFPFELVAGRLHVPSLLAPRLERGGTGLAEALVD